MRLTPLGDRAVIIEVATTIGDAAHALVLAVMKRLTTDPFAGMVELVPAFTSVAVYYDPAVVARTSGGATPYAHVEAEIRTRLDRLDAAALDEGRDIEIPVTYGGELGPDLEEVARHAGLTEDEVVAIHSGASYRVYMIGFNPGFPYLGGLDDRLATPRRSTPRTLVPASSVGIGGPQTGIYPLDSPGGWQIIGRTPLRLFRPDRDPPTLLEVGDRVRFRRIDRDEFAELQSR